MRRPMSAFLLKSGRVQRGGSTHADREPGKTGPTPGNQPGLVCAVPRKGKFEARPGGKHDPLAVTGADAAGVASPGMVRAAPDPGPEDAPRARDPDPAKQPADGRDGARFPPRAGRMRGRRGDALICPPPETAGFRAAFRAAAGNPPGRATGPGTTLGRLPHPRATAG